MGKKQANKKPETVPIDQISIWAQKHSWDSFLRMSAVFRKSGVQKKVEETIGIFLGTVFKYMKMTLTWYKGDDISHQQPVTIRRKQKARKPRQWVAMKAWLEGASQNKNQDSLYWKIMHLYVGVPHQNLLNLIIQMKKFKVRKKITPGPLTTAAGLQVSCRYAVVRTDQHWWSCGRI